jgi:excinuclease ABC subunit A
VKLGQAGPTLSGGEAQRVKLASELARPDTGRTLYVLDEPTTGLHLDDVKKLLAVIHRLADLGNTVVIIEHNLEVIKTSDWVMDLGPEAGAAGGRIVAQGTPEDVARVRASLTGAILKGALAASPREERERFDPKAAAKKIIDEARKADPGAEVRPPWEVDGRAWHTRDRLTRTGKPVRWDGAILETVVSHIEALGLFPETDWSQRSLVRIRSDDDGPPFFEALTGHEWIVTLRFRAARGTFKPSSLESRLGLAPFHQASRPVMSDAPRVKIATVRGGQEIEVTGHSVEDFASTEFADFVDRAARSFSESTGGTLEVLSIKAIEDRLRALTKSS